MHYFIIFYVIIFQTAFVHYFTKLGTGDSYYWDNDSPSHDGGQINGMADKMVNPLRKKKTSRKKLEDICPQTKR